MKKAVMFLAIILVFCVCGSASAFWDSGEIEPYPGIEFDDLKIKGNMVYGVLENNTDQHIRIFVSLLFCDIFKNCEASAYIVEEIPANGSKTFRDYIKGNFKEAKKASKLIWVR